MAKSRRLRTSRAVRWVMWNPMRALLVGGAVVMVTVLGVSAYLLTAANDALLWANERQAAQRTAAAEVQKQREVGGGPFIRPAAAPTPATASTSSAPVPTVPASPTASKDAEATARAFLTAWAKGPTAPSDSAWITGLQPHTAPDLLDLFRLTDRQQVPAGAKIQSVSVVAVAEPNASVEANVTGVGKLGMKLERSADGKWVVSELTPEDGHE